VSAISELAALVGSTLGSAMLEDCLRIEVGPRSCISGPQGAILGKAYPILAAMEAPQTDPRALVKRMNYGRLRPRVLDRT
jgi:hypothetical protein